MLLCSHIEGFVKELGMNAIVNIAAQRIPKTAFLEGFRYYLSRDFIKRIQNSQEPETIESIVMEMMQRDLHIWDDSTIYSSSLPAGVFVENIGSPNHKRIKKFFRRFGFKDFEHQLKSTLKGDFLSCFNMMRDVVLQRNQIAHGDFSTTGAPSDLEDMVTWADLYCRTADEIVCAWFGGKGVHLT